MSSADQPHGAKTRCDLIIHFDTGSPASALRKLLLFWVGEETVVDDLSAMVPTSGRENN